MLLAAGHAVLSASGAASCRTLAESVTPDALWVPEGPIGDDALGWAADLLGDTPVVRIADGADAMTGLASVGSEPRPPGEPTEDLSEAEIFAAIEATAPPVPTLPVSAALATPSTPRRSATLRSTSAGPLIADKLNEVRFGDYHAILEVQPGASAYVIRQQFDALRGLDVPQPVSVEARQPCKAGS